MSDEGAQGEIEASLRSAGGHIREEYGVEPSDCETDADLYAALSETENGNE